MQECVRVCVCVCVCVQKKKEESRRWDENGGHNGRMKNKNSSICISCASSPVFMVLCWPRTLRGTLLHCHICWSGSFFSAPSEAAASLIPVRPSQDAHTNTATKQKLSLNSQTAIKGVCAHSRSTEKGMCCGFNIQSWTPLRNPEQALGRQWISLQMLCQMLQRGN